MGYLQDVTHYMSGTECPRSFVVWSAMALAGAVAGRKVYVKHGDYFSFYPNLYVALVGTPGSGKSVSKDMARDLLLEVWPEYPISAEIQSHQNICRCMASAQGTFTWKNCTGPLEVYRPFFSMPDELQLFFSTDKAGMMGFLVGAHSSKYFSTGFNNAEALGVPQIINNPYLSLLGCSAPEWFMGNLKVDLFSGGAGRRFIIVYDKKTELKSRPTKPAGAGEAYARIINHLKCLREYGGCSYLDPDAIEWWDKWYVSKESWKYKDDPIVGQFHETKPMMVLKVALLLSKNELPFTDTIKQEHLIVALAMLNDLEPRVIRLTSGIGRNVLAGIGAELLEKIDLSGGQAMEKKFRMQFYRNLRDEEWKEVLQHFIETQELYYVVVPDDNQVPRGILFLPYKYNAVFVYHCPHCKARYPKEKICCGFATPRLPTSPPANESGNAPSPVPA